MIKIKLVLNENVEVFGIYDSGSNVSLINSKLLKIKNEETGLSNKTNLKTINGVKKANGIITLDVTIFDLKKKMNVFVIDKENFDYDFLVGLDCIKEFYLVQNENLEISQKIPIQRNEIVSKEANKKKRILRQ